ncbi:DUF5677 domain-containing protein [Spirosoma sp. RP8]|uniref:DUF5677 domain-containing protein n=1 Tax=Spirosoma liriopis TaxID=2937440 RepID=A0ABT0HR01_9BACT|nr:DUF5677 domain-containing protein [Spirosoma liriopis]MCK8494608.1 DUF5677 domain-containing protein [Spirosoma liriopis]
MPHKKTEPVPSILSRQLEGDDVIQAISLYTEGLDEFVNFGTHFLDWELKRNEIEITDVVVTSMFRRILEIVDSISILLKEGAADPCKVLLRSLFEIVLSFEYLLKEDTKRRAQCYRYSTYNKQLIFNKRHSPKHPSYKDYQQSYSRGQVFKNVPTVPDLEGRIEELQKLIDRPDYAEIKAEFVRVGNGSWFTPFSDLTNRNSKGKPTLLKKIQDLAEYLNKFDLYEILYKDWSNSVHGSDTITGTFFMNKEQQLLSMMALRQPVIAHEVTNITFRLVELTIGLMTKRNHNQFGDVVWWVKSFHVNYTKPILDRLLTFDMPE